MISCADPESFVSGGGGLRSKVLTYVTEEEGVITYTQLSINGGHHPPTSKTPFKWWFAGGPMMAQHWMLVGSLMMFQRLWTSIHK